MIRAGYRARIRQDAYHGGWLDIFATVVEHDSCKGNGSECNCFLFMHTLIQGNIPSNSDTKAEHLSTSCSRVFRCRFFIAAACCSSFFHSTDSLMTGEKGWDKCYRKVIGKFFPIGTVRTVADVATNLRVMIGSFWVTDVIPSVAESCNEACSREPLRRSYLDLISHHRIIIKIVNLESFRSLPSRFPV